MTSPEPYGALYYPYIYIRDDNWLKANLLMFPHMEGMIPEAYLPVDSDVVRAFTKYDTRSGPLLRSAEALYSPTAQLAQRILASKLRKDAENELFLLKYGQVAAQQLIGPDSYGFQIHAAKLSHDLINALSDKNKLGWKPGLMEPYDFNEDYIEVHPNVGQAIMATLAIACAQSSGLDIVGDARSGPLHQCLLEREMEQVYNTWLFVEAEKIQTPAAVTGEALFEYLVGIPKDNASLSALTPEKIHELAQERKQINLLMRKLREKAASIRAVEDVKVKQQAFLDASSDIFREWNNDRNNFGNYGRAFLGQDTTKMANDFAKTVADRTLTHVGVGAATTATTAVASGAVAGAGWFGSLATGGLIGAGAGLVIGLIVHAGTTYRRQARREKESPYRFLTSLENAGVVFRSGSLA